MIIPNIGDIIKIEDTGTILYAKITNINKKNKTYTALFYDTLEDLEKNLDPIDNSEYGMDEIVKIIKPYKITNWKKRIQK